MMSGLTAGFTSAIEGVSSDVTSVVGTIAPPVLVIVGSIAAVMIGFKLFKKFTNKAG